MSSKRKTRFNLDLEEYELEDEEEEKEPSPLDSFLEQAKISEVLHVVKSGKEATVYCCRAHSSTGYKYLAAKVYLSRQNRNFKNDSAYRDGRVILNGHTKRAVKKKTSFGQQAQQGMWISYEWENMKILYKARADIPRPVAMTGGAILMEYFGEPYEPAPLLQNVELEPEEALPLFKQMMRNIELWLANNLIHGDLSPFNVLYVDGTLKIIDFPQTVDARFNPNAYSLLCRDIGNIVRYFSRYGVEADTERIASRLWHRFQNSQL